MASYIDRLKKANPEAYKKLEGCMPYLANEIASVRPTIHQQIASALGV